MPFPDDKNLLETYGAQKNQLNIIQRGLPDFEKGMIFFGLAYYELAGRRISGWNFDESIDVSFLEPYFSCLVESENSDDESDLPIPDGMDQEEFLSQLTILRQAHQALCKRMVELNVEFAALANSTKDKKAYQNIAIIWYQANKKLASDAQITEEIKKIEKELNQEVAETQVSSTPKDTENNDQLIKICKEHQKQIEQLLGNTDFIDSYPRSQEGEVSIVDLLDFGYEFYHIALGILENEPVVQTSEDYANYIRAILFNQDINQYNQNQKNDFEKFKSMYKDLCQIIGEWQIKHNESTVESALSWYEIEASLKEQVKYIRENVEQTLENAEKNASKKKERKVWIQEEELQARLEKDEADRKVKEQSRDRIFNTRRGKQNEELEYNNKNKADLLLTVAGLDTSLKTVEFLGKKLLSDCALKSGSDDIKQLTLKVLTEIAAALKALEVISADFKKLPVVDPLSFSNIKDSERGKALKINQDKLKKYTTALEDIILKINPISKDPNRFKARITKLSGKLSRLENLKIESTETHVSSRPIKNDNSNTPTNSDTENNLTKGNQNTSTVKVMEPMTQKVEEDLPDSSLVGPRSKPRVFKSRSLLENKFNRLTSLTQGGASLRTSIYFNSNDKSKKLRPSLNSLFVQKTVDEVQVIEAKESANKKEEIFENPILILLHEDKPGSMYNLTTETIALALKTIRNVEDQLKALQEAYEVLNGNNLLKSRLTSAQSEQANLFCRDNGASLKLYPDANISGFFAKNKHTGFNQHLSDTQIKHLKILKLAVAAISLEYINKTLDKTKALNSVMSKVSGLIKANTTRYDIFTKVEKNIIFNKQTYTEKTIRKAAPAA